MDKFESHQDILERKLKHPHGVYDIRFDDGTLIPFRTLTYKEYRLFLDMMANEYDVFRVWGEQFAPIHHTIYKTCVLDSFYRDNPEYLKAGIPFTIGRLIFFLSAPESLEDLTSLINEYRQSSSNVEEQMKMVVCSSFPGYTLEKLDDLPYKMLVRLFVGAESLITMRGGEPFQILDPREQKPKDNGTITKEELQQHNHALRR